MCVCVRECVCVCVCVEGAHKVDCTRVNECECAQARAHEREGMKETYRCRDRHTR